MVLIIGLGSIAAKHINALLILNPAIRIIALRSSADCKKMDCVEDIYSVDELNDKPQFVIISNPTHLHFSTIEFAIKLQVPLFIEKPPLHILHNAISIVSKLKENNIHTYVACNLRFHPCIQFLKKYFSSNKVCINEVNIYCGSYLPDWRPNQDFTRNYSANESMGGGVHLDLFHELDYAYWLFGKPLDSRSFKSSKSSLKINAVDYANYIFNYETFNIAITLNYYRRTPKRTIEILFDDKTWFVNLIDCVIKGDAGEVIFENKNYNIQQTYISQLKYFIDSIENPTNSINTFSESLEVLKICLSDE